MLTRGYTSPGSGSGGLSSIEHETLDTFTHKVAEDSFVSFDYSAGVLTQVTIWTSPSMVLKIRQSILTYVGDVLTRVVQAQYDALGDIVSTLTKVFSYSGDDIANITVTEAAGTAWNDASTWDDAGFWGLP